ncbi:MAG TPA: lipid-A-disaccharide synthase [Steroidobacteraceae bacterium]
MNVGLVAGDSSGDTLGAALIQALRAQVPNVKCFGVAGPKMIAAGCEAWASADELAVMGLAEIVHHLPRLLRLRKSLLERFTAARPDVFVGIDSPEFNLGMAKRLKQRGLRTVQYVSPQVWAWRQGRVRTIGKACDLVLCLLPFETDFYAKYGVRAVFVGHPLADQIPLEVDRGEARRALGIDSDATVIALLPGSRMGEVERLGADFAAAATWIAGRVPGARFIAPMASARVRAAFERHVAAAGVSLASTPGPASASVPASMSGSASVAATSAIVPQSRGVPVITLLDGQAQRALAASDGVIVASGTATLETLLTGRPMVVAYRLSAMTAFLLRSLGLVKVPYFSQPNLLVGRRLVPEFFQEEVSGSALGAALLHEIENPQHVAELTREFRTVHEVLRRGGAERAAAAILELLA